MKVATLSLASHSATVCSYGNARGTAEPSNCLTLAVSALPIENTHSQQLTSELSGAALAASGGGPKGRNELERLVSCGWGVHQVKLRRCRQKSEARNPLLLDWRYPGSRNCISSGPKRQPSPPDCRHKRGTPRLATPRQEDSYGARGTAELPTAKALAVLRCFLTI